MEETNSKLLPPVAKEQLVVSTSQQQQNSYTYKEQIFRQKWTL